MSFHLVINTYILHEMINSISCLNTNNNNNQKWFFPLRSIVWMVGSVGRFSKMKSGKNKILPWLNRQHVSAGDQSKIHTHSHTHTTRRHTCTHILLFILNSPLTHTHSHAQSEIIEVGWPLNTFNLLFTFTPSPFSHPRVWTVMKISQGIVDVSSIYKFSSKKIILQK